VNSLELYHDSLTLKKQKLTYQNVSYTLSHLFYGLTDAYDAIQGINNYRQRAKIHPEKAKSLYFSTQTLRMYTNTEASLSLSSHSSLFFHTFAASLTLNTLVSQSLQKTHFHQSLFVFNYIQQLLLMGLYTDMLLNKSQLFFFFKNQVSEMKSLLKTKSVQDNIELRRLDDSLSVSSLSDSNTLQRHSSVSSLSDSNTLERHSSVSSLSDSNTLRLSSLNDDE
jgi:hypothetical protein